MIPQEDFGKAEEMTVERLPCDSTDCRKGHCYHSITPLAVEGPIKWQRLHVPQCCRCKRYKTSFKRAE